ncbi:MAG: 4-hydroxythreonine-4-phosphate dehydrogenase PdxA [Spirochaetota bacterium]|nr:4-hydroxythreonine-4-phosphate dehydrogenase PdxA [Spirochaetota bacterium]
MKSHSIRVGIVIGDPAGIGPEVALKAVSELDGIDNIIPIVIGRYEVLVRHYPDLVQGYRLWDYKRDTPSDILDDHNYIYNICLDLPIPTPGKGNIYTGIESIKYIDKAIELWRCGTLDSIVTGPVNKGLIEKSGCRFTGHTEYIAESIQEKNPYMMMYSKDYRVMLVTTHIPVSGITERIDSEKIYNTIIAGHRAISRIDGKEVRIAITGLDPHCGDRGAIGNFDMNVTEKAVSMAKSDGINIEGPFAADTLFLPERWRSYNLVIAQYHDQGLIPFKTLTFDTGVNVTMGLSIIRTSVAHGTAYDIAGKGCAKYKSMIEAITLAYLLAENKSTI